MLDRDAYLGVPQQLQHSSFIRGESRNFANDRSHKLVFGGLDALALAGARDLGKGRGGMALVGATTKV